MEQLKAQKPLVQAYVMDEIFDKMIGGEAAVGVYYSGDAITMIDDQPRPCLGVPRGGQRPFGGLHVHPASSQNQEAAEMFINFMCEVDVGVANAEYIGYTTPSTAVWEQLDEELKYSEIAYPSEEIAAKEQVFTALSEEVNSELDVKWSEMKSYDEGRQRLPVPPAAAGHDPAGLLQHLAQDAQEDAEQVLTRSPHGLERSNLMQDHSTYTEQITLDEGDVDYRGLMRPSGPAALRRAHGHRPRLGPGDGQSLLQRAAHGLSGGPARPSSFTACPPCGRPSP